jgi:hypothetical protein
VGRPGRRCRLPSSSRSPLLLPGAAEDRDRERTARPARRTSSRRPLAPAPSPPPAHPLAASRDTRSPRWGLVLHGTRVAWSFGIQNPEGFRSLLGYDLSLGEPRTVSVLLR